MNEMFKTWTHLVNLVTGNPCKLHSDTQNQQKFKCQTWNVSGDQIKAFSSVIIEINKLI